MIEIKVVGPGCMNCETLEALCKEAITQLGLEARIEKVSDRAQFLDLGVMLTPGLLINGKLVSMGKLPSRESILKWLTMA